MRDSEKWKSSQSFVAFIRLTLFVSRNGPFQEKTGKGTTSCFSVNFSG